MTIRGEKISFVQLTLSFIGGCIALILAMMAWFLSDMAGSVKSAREDIAAIKADMKNSHEQVAEIKREQNDLRVILYEHFTKDGN